MAQGRNTVTLRFSLASPLARVMFGLIVVALCAALGRLIIAQFIVGVFSDPRTTLTKAELQAAATYYPDSSILQSLLAEAEMTEAADHEGTAARAVSLATRAANLSPWRHDLRMILASAQDLNGNRAAAEASLREAIRLAPNNAEVHWRLANLLVRESKLDAALDYFRAAVTADITRLPSVLNLVWDVSDGKVSAVDAVAGSKPGARLGLAFFLFKQARLDEAAEIFAQVDRQARIRAASETANFLNALTSAGKADLSRKLWAELAIGKRGGDLPLVWNGGFEEDLATVQARFDWEISSSKYAAVAIDPGAGRTGSRSLRVDFAGVDTTTLDGEFKQLILVRPGGRYRLECFVKTRNLATPEGPRLVILGNASSSPIATTAPVAAGSNDWQPLAVDFIVPADAKTIEIRIRRQPKFSYDEPTNGIIWFDDISLTELIGPGGRK